MEAIIIHPDGPEQLKTVKAVLKALNVRFEKQASLLPHVAASIEKGLEQYKNGSIISLDDFKKNHFSTTRANILTIPYY